MAIKPRVMRYRPHRFHRKIGFKTILLLTHSGLFSAGSDFQVEDATARSSFKSRVPYHSSHGCCTFSLLSNELQQHPENSVRPGQKPGHRRLLYRAPFKRPFCGPRPSIGSGSVSCLVAVHPGSRGQEPPPPILRRGRLPRPEHYSLGECWF